MLLKLQSGFYTCYKKETQKSKKVQRKKYIKTGVSRGISEIKETKDQRLVAPFCTFSASNNNLFLFNHQSNIIYHPAMNKEIDSDCHIDEKSEYKEPDLLSLLFIQHINNYDLLSSANLFDFQEYFHFDESENLKIAMILASTMLKSNVYLDALHNFHPSFSVEEIIQVIEKRFIIDIIRDPSLCNKQELSLLDIKE
jgi:hypothetical protein